MNNLPIVGARFRPPADIILNSLPGGMPLLLVRDPLNPHDPNAIQVMLPAGWQATLPAGLLLDMKEQVSNAGQIFPETDDEMYHLGFVPRGIAEQMAPVMDAEGGEHVRCLLAYDPAGKPVCVGEPEEEQDEETPGSDGLGQDFDNSADPL